MTEVLDQLVTDLPPIDAAMIDTMVTAPTPPAPMHAVAVACGTTPLDLKKLDLTAVALAQFGDWRAAVAKLKADNEKTVLVLPTQAKIDEAVSLRQRTIKAPLAEARKVETALKSKLAQVSKAVGAELAELIAGYEDAGTPLTRQIEAAQKIIDDEKEAKRQAENVRLSGLREAVDTIMDRWLERCNLEGMTAERLGKGIEGLELTPTPAEVIDVADYWRTKKQETLQAMDKLKAAAAAREESARLEAQRLENERVAAELAAQRAELERQRVEVERAAAEILISDEDVAAAFDRAWNRCGGERAYAIRDAWAAAHPNIIGRGVHRNAWPDYIKALDELQPLAADAETAATTEGKAETPGAGSAEAAPLADDWDDIPACPGCGAMAGCCQDFPNCPGGQGATSQPVPGGSPAKTSEVNDDDESDRGRTRRLAGAGYDDSTGPVGRAVNPARDDGAAAHDAGLLRAFAHGDPRQGDAEHAGLTGATHPDTDDHGADLLLDPGTAAAEAADEAAEFASWTAGPVELIEAPAVYPSPLLDACADFVALVAQARGTNLPSQPTMGPEWWAALYSAADRIQATGEVL